MRYTGKVALVTGSTRGIGAATAARFAREGAAVIVTGRTEAEGNKVVDHIREDGGTACFIQMDLGREDDVRDCFETVDKEFGALHVLVNNAMATDALGGESPIAEQTTDAFDAIVKVGLYGTFWCCKYGIALMTRSDGGSVINISSLAAAVGVEAMPARSSPRLRRCRLVV